MTAETIEPEDILLPLLEPIFAFMLSHQMVDLHIRASPDPEPVAEDLVSHAVVDEEFIYCSAEPGPGVQGIYAVTDDQGEGRLDGPSSIPQTVLRPLLKALSDLNVDQLHISTVREAADNAEVSPVVVPPARPNPDEFDEDATPNPSIIHAVIPFASGSDENK